MGCIVSKGSRRTQIQKAREIGFRAIQALGLQTGMTHMEWFVDPMEVLQLVK